ncbi:MAG: autotransporter domain-containing protein, partial [Akkermansia sp.]
TRSNASMASLSNEATAVDMANSTLAVAGDATIGSIALSDGSSADIGHLKGSFDAATDATSAITLDQITGDAASNIQGVITLDSADPAVANSYAGTYNGGVALAMTAGTNATLEQGAGLALTAAANTVTTINNASGGAVTSINSQGTVNLGTMGASMNVAEVSRINAGELNFTIAQDALDKGINAGTGFVVTKGAAFNLTGNTTVNIAADPNSYKDQIIDVAKLQSDTNVLVTFSEGATVDADVVLNFESTVYEKYFKDVKVVGNTIVGTLNRNTYGSLLGKGNGADGLAIIGDALIELNPQKNFKDTGAQKDLASIMDSMDNYKATSDSASANRTAAAIAGASVTAINSAALAGMTNQVSNLYNRAQSRALGMVDGKPGFQAWIQAESFFSDLEHEGNYFSGHKYDAWGASVGADGAISKNMVVGAAFTSMFGDLDSNVADYGNGDMNTYYLSLYARYGVGSWSHSFVGSLGLSSIGFDRTVSFDGNSYKSSGDTNGIGYGLGYELAYRFDLNESKTKAISPIFNASLINNHISGYTETGTDAALRIGSQDNTYLSLGFGAQYEQFVGQKVFNRDVMLGARAMLVTNVGNQSSTADVSFASNPGTISRIDGASPSPAAFQLGAGVSIPVSAKGSSVYCNVNYEVSTKYSDFNANLGYRYSF